MSVKTVLATTALVIASMMTAQAALAQSRMPAEIPPLSYVGTQFVDSKGCVFIRAGSGGTVTWVPRIERDRAQICNARPTVIGGANNTGRVTAASASTGVVQLTIPQAGQTQTRVTPPRVTFRPEVQTPAPAPSQNLANNAAPTQPRVTTIAPQANTRTVTLTPRNAAVLPVLVPNAPAAVTTSVRTVTAAPQRQASANACGVTGISAQYTNRGQHGPVRCGGQAMHPADYARAGGALQGRPAAAVSGANSGAPFEAVNPNPQLAAGYRPAWEDGRLNPNRGPRGGAGLAAGDRVLMWTTYAPYRLIDVATGQDVTASYPQYQPPTGPVAAATGSYNFAPQVSNRGSYLETMSSRTPRATTVRGTNSAATAQRTRTPAAQVATARGATQVTVGRGHRYVQLGAYGDPANVTRAIATLHRLGLPAAKIRTSRGVELVVSGPFNDPQALGSALQRARGAGYGDAITRR